MGLLAFTCLPTLAQPGFNLAFMPRQGEAQWLQPAWLLADSSEQLRLGAGFGYRLASNALSTRQVTSLFGSIDEAAKADLLGSLSNQGNYLQQGQRYSLLANARRGPLVGGLSYRRRIQSTAYLDRPDLLGLLLYGNARYEDQPIGGNPALELGTYDEVGLALGYQGARWQAALRLKLLLGQEYLSLRNALLTLYTAPLGEYLDLAGGYALFQTEPGRRAGFGLGLDAGVVFRPNPDLTLQAALIDWGGLTWQGHVREPSFDFRYAGAELGSFSLDDGALYRGPDSLLSQVWPDSVAGEGRMQLPARAHLGMSYRLAGKHRIQGAVAYGWTFGGLRGLLGYGAYSYQFAPWGQVGISTFYGHTERRGVGLWGETSFDLPSGGSLRVFLSGDNVLGLLLPAQQSGIGLQAGATVGL